MFPGREKQPRLAAPEAPARHLETEKNPASSRTSLVDPLLPSSRRSRRSRKGRHQSETVIQYRRLKTGYRLNRC